VDTVYKVIYTSYNCIIIIIIIIKLVCQLRTCEAYEQRDTADTPASVTT